MWEVAGCTTPKHVLDPRKQILCSHRRGLTRILFTCVGPASAESHGGGRSTDVTYLQLSLLGTIEALHRSKRQRQVSRVARPKGSCLMNPPLEWGNHRDRCERRHCQFALRESRIEALYFSPTGVVRQSLHLFNVSQHHYHCINASVTHRRFLMGGSSTYLTKPSFLLETDHPAGAPPVGITS